MCIYIYIYIYRYFLKELLGLKEMNYCELAFLSMRIYLVTSQVGSVKSYFECRCVFLLSNRGLE